MDNYQIDSYSGAEIEALLGKIDDLGNASQSTAGLMSAADKTKLDGLDSGAQANVLEGVKIAGADLPITEKKVNIPADSSPTSGSNSLVRSGGVFNAIKDFITRSVNDLVNYYTKTEVNNIIGSLQQFHYEIYASTSAVVNPQSNVLYLIGPTGTGSDKYEEYVYSNGWVKIGDTTIDLSGYPTTEQMNAAINNALEDYATKEEVSQLGQQVDELREDVGEKNTVIVRHDIADSSNFTNSGKGVIADSGAANFGNTSSNSSMSATGYVDVSQYAGRKLKFTLPKVTSSTSPHGVVFYSGATVASAISGITLITGAAEIGYELVEADIPANAANVRFTFITSELANFQAYVEVSEGDGKYTSGIGKEVQDLQDTVEQVDERLNNAETSIDSISGKIDEIYDGTEEQVFEKSVISQLGHGTLPVPIVLSQVGDYVEFKVLLTDGRSQSYNYFLMLNPGGANQPNISIYSRSQFSIRLPGKTGNNFTDSTLFANGNTIEAKIVLDSVTDGVYAYKVYINDVEREYTDLTCSSPFTLDSVGRSGLSEGTTATNAADWYYLKYKTGGVEYTIDEFSTKLTSPSGISDVYSTRSAYGLDELTEKVKSLEDFSAPGILRYTAEDEQFEFLSRYGMSNKYFSFIVKHTVNANVLRNLWRVMGGNLYTFANGVFNLEHSTIYGSSENEWAALFSEFKAQNNYTGGYHGGEMITDAGCFVKFFADGVEITDLSADFEIPCERFEYIQYSALHEVYETDGVTPVPGQPIFAYHTKHTSFQDAEMDCRNDVSFVLSCTRRSYHAGLFSPQRNAGTTAVIPFGIVATLSGTGNMNMASYGKNVSEIVLWHQTNNCGVSITSDFIAGISEDEMAILGTGSGKAELGILDNGNGRTDAKYYKRTNHSVAITSGEVISTRHVAKFYGKINS